MNDARGVGRPPGPHDDTLAKLLPTALELFLAEGGGALTPTRLHQETGVARATIYRNWPEPPDLIEIMLQRATDLTENAPPTDDLRDDLHEAMAGLRWRFDERPARAFFAACLEYGRRSDRVAKAAQAFIAGILEPFRRAIDAALDRGDIEGDLDDLVAEICGPPILRHVVMGESIDEAAGAAIVDRFADHHLR
ncbi:MAG: TetR-like C-terminal domain-containing protein [Actinomycetota bacterium]